MKAIVRLFVVSGVLMFGVSLWAEAQKSEKKQSKKEARDEKKAEQFAQIKDLVESRSFIFNAERAFPSGMRSIDLVSNPGTLKVKDASAEADLPFFGRSYTNHYSGSTGMDFKGKIENEKVKFNEKKQKVIYTFRVKDSDVYDVTMDITFDGGCSLTINSHGKNSISYGGKIKKIEDKEKK